MPTLYLDNTSAGAPALVSGNGTFVAILDWALPQAGWTIDYSSGHYRIYRPPAGKRMVMQVIDDSAVSGGLSNVVVRGAESATGFNTLVDPFPTVAQVSNLNCNWAKLGSTTSSATGRAYWLIISDRHVLFAAESRVGTGLCDFGLWGELPPTQPGDAWSVACMVRNVSGANTNDQSATSYPLIEKVSGPSINTSPTAAAACVFWARDITGAVKSSLGALGSTGSKWGYVPGLPAARAGYANRVLREKLSLHCYGTAVNSFSPASTVGATIRRAFVPNVWGLMHSSSVGMATGDTFTDTNYNPAAQFKYLNGYASSGNASIILETTDTWALPTDG